MKFLDRRQTTAKAFAKNVFLDQGRKYVVRRRVDTTLVLIITVPTSDPPVLVPRLDGQLSENQSLSVPGEVWLQRLWADVGRCDLAADRAQSPRYLPRGLVKFEARPLMMNKPLQ